MTIAWPDADIDPIARLRVLAAALPGAVVTERVIPAAPDAVWALAADLEHTVPRIQPHVVALTVTHRDGERLVADVRGHLGLRARMNVVLRPDWCWIASRFLVVGMAAAPHPEGTRFGWLQAVRFPAARAAAPFARTAIEAELERLAMLAGPAAQA
jgi:hypothetical protein